MMLLEKPDEPRDAEAARREVHDRIQDELTRGMVRRASAALGRMTGEAARAEILRRRQDVGHLGAPPERDGGRMLEREADVRTTVPACAPGRFLTASDCSYAQSPSHFQEMAARMGEV